MYEDLIVKKSSIPGSGKGLFTKIDIKKGERIVEYFGEIINWKECNIRAERDEGGYVFYVSKNKCIDAFHTPEALARYANDAKGLIKIKGFNNNCNYEIYKKTGWVSAIKDIKAGSEILVGYGAEYWRDIRYNIRFEAKQKLNLK